jgi:hypothetical protein
VGIADFTTRRLYEKLDPQKMFMNGLTANALAAIKIPPFLDTDRQALGVALHSIGQAEQARLAVVHSTLQLDELWVSEALIPEVEASRNLSIVGEVTDLPFDTAGRLTLFSSREHAAASV